MLSIKKVICIIISIFMVGRVLAYSQYQVMASEGEEAKELIYKLIEMENNSNWDEYPNLWCEEKKYTFKALFSNERHISEKKGILGVNSAEIKSIEKIPNEEVMRSISEIIEEYSHIECYLTGIDYTVENVTKSFYNGVNYRLIVVGEENAVKKILSVMEAPEYLLEEGNDSYDKQVAKDIIEARREGYIMDSDMSIVGEYEKVSENSFINGDAQLCGYNPGYNYNTKYNLRVPETINIWVSYDYDNHCKLPANKCYLDEVGLGIYVKRVLPREMVISTSPLEALKAQVVCIQQYAIWHVLYYSKYPNEGYDLTNTTNDQAYDKYYDTLWVYSEYQKKVDSAYKAASPICMVIKSTGALFESLYCENKNSNKNLGYGTLYQEGAITLAGEYGRSYIDILKAYYNYTKLYPGSTNLEISFRALYK